MANQV